VVVVGGGFAGLRVCRALKRVKVRVNLIDKRNFNLLRHCFIKWLPDW
jgi:NADH dehydrogenase